MLTIKSGDTAVVFDSILVKEDSQEDWNLDGATVYFVLKRNVEVFVVQAQIVSSSERSVRYTVDPADNFPVDPGKYSQEWKVVFSDDTILRFPNSKYNEFNIKSNLEGTTQSFPNRLNLVLDGDSNTSGSAGTPYQDNLVPLLETMGYDITVANVAVSGYKYKDVIAHYVSLVRPLLSTTRDNVYVINAGNNDLYLSDGLSYTRTIYGVEVLACAIDSLETVQAYILQLVALAQADGWKVKLATVPIRPANFTDPRTWPPDRYELNNWLRAQCVTGGLLEGVALGDWAGDQNLEYKPHAPGDVDAIYDALFIRYNGREFPTLYYSTSYYLSDSTHLNSTGAAAVAALDAAAIDSLL